jgi:O-antigen biosynthesis protein WbqP
MVLVVMKRKFDIVVSFVLMFFILPFAIICSIVVWITSKGPILHTSVRIGADNKPFKMLKFRTMKIDTPQVATHLLTDPQKYITVFGSFLRKTSLDELPQLINVLKGDMSLVGPRPALFNQYDQIELRKKVGCHVLKPGITGWAQINGRDEITVEKKVELDRWYFENQSFFLDIKILFRTFVNVLFAKHVSH